MGPLGSHLAKGGAGEAPPRVGRTLGAAAPPLPPLLFNFGRCINAEEISTESMVLYPPRPPTDLKSSISRRVELPFQHTHTWSYSTTFLYSCYFVSSSGTRPSCKGELELEW